MTPWYIPTCYHRNFSLLSFGEEAEEDEEETMVVSKVRYTASPYPSPPERVRAKLSLPNYTQA